MLATVTAAWAFASESSDKNFVDVAVEPWMWVAFLALITTLLLVDLLVLHRDAHVISTKAAAIEAAVWVTIGLSFALVVLNAAGRAGRLNPVLAVATAVAGCLVASVTRYAIGATPAADGPAFIVS